MALTEQLRAALNGRVAVPEPAFRLRALRAYDQAVERHLRRRRLRAARQRP